MLIFVRLIFIAAIDYENIFTTKISRFTVPSKGSVMWLITISCNYMYNILLSSVFTCVWGGGGGGGEGGGGTKGLREYLYIG